MGKRVTLTRSEDYSRVHSRGASRATSLVVIRTLPNSLDVSRYGFSVSRHVGKAVVRNKIKRRLREILQRVTLQPGWDIVFIVRSKAAEASYGDLRERVSRLLAQAGLITGEQ